MIKFMTLLMALMVFSACTIGPPPKVDTGILNMKKRQFEFKNYKGTKFNISLDTKNPSDIKYLHNQICGPGNQVIDLFSWFQKVMTQIKDDYYNKR